MIYHGSIPGETEIGHLRLDKQGTTLQSSCSGWAVDEKVRKAIEANPTGKLAALAKTNEGPEAMMLGAAVQYGDPDAWKIFNETWDDLALGLSHVVHLLHPHTIILGGGLSLMGDMILPVVKEKLSHYLMDAFQPGPPIQLSELKEDAVPAGALALAIQTQ
jgi:glucokinase